MGPFAARVVPGLISNSRTRKIFQDQHDLGVKDWELILILFNIALNHSIQVDPRGMSAAAYGDLRKRIATMSERLLDGTAASRFESEWLTAEELPMHMRVAIGTVAQSWGLSVQRSTPDFDAIRKLLVNRFRHFDDDVEHDDWFGWKAAQG
jgi:hypothetical protein